MSAAQRYLLTIDGNAQEAAEICAETAKKLESGATKLLDVVQSLGEYLTDDDATIRAKAVTFYAGVIAALDPKFLTRQQISVSVQFFCDRIQDESGLKEAAQGLKALQRCQRFTNDDAVKIATALFAVQDLQRHPQSTRFVVVTLLDALMSDQRPALKGMGETAIRGITDLVAGEKDPRNLMVIFSLLRVVMVEWDISYHVESLFDAVFCYFPITFRPPPDDPFKITAQDLKERLRDCLASTTRFAGHLFPALLEKLDSTSANVKKDVLQTVMACARSYTPTSVANYSAQLWDAVRFEILSAQEEEVTEDALRAVAAIAECLSKDTSKAGSRALARYLGSITAECNKQLQEPQAKQAKPVGQLLGAIATASIPAFVEVVKTTVAPLLTIYQDAGGIGKQRALLSVPNRLLEAAVNLYGTWASREPYPEQSNPLEPFKDRLYEMYSRALMSSGREETSLRLVAVKGLLRSVELRNYLDGDEIGMVVQYLDDVLLDEDIQDQEELKNETIEALTCISKLKPRFIMDITFPAFMATLPDCDRGMPKRYLSCLEVLARLSVEEHVFEVLLRRLLNRLDVVLQNESTADYVCAILSTLLYVLSQRALENDSKLQLYYDRLVVGLIRRVVQPVMASGQLTALHEEPALHVIGKLATTIGRALPAARQGEVAQNVYVLFTPGYDSLDGTENMTKESKRTIILSTHLIASIRREISFSADIKSVFAKLIDWSLRESDLATRPALLVQISLIANKWLLPDHAEFVQSMAERARSMLAADNPSTEASSPPSDTQGNALRLLLWLSKAAILRLDALFTPLVDQLLGLLSHPRHGLATARGFSILVAPHELLSTTSNFVVVRLLHKQRLFSYCIPKLAADFRSAAVERKSNHLVALAGILRHMPTEVILPQLDALLPLLLQSIELPDANVKYATLQVLMVTLTESAKSLEGHVAGLIHRLLDCASISPSGRGSTMKGVHNNPPRVRMAALQCLGQFPTAFGNRLDLLLPHRAGLVKKLVASLDDAKRDVRKEAVDCRAAWLRMDEPGD